MGATSSIEVANIVTDDSEEVCRTLQKELDHTQQRLGNCRTRLSHAVNTADEMTMIAMQRSLKTQELERKMVLRYRKERIKVMKIWGEYCALKYGEILNYKSREGATYLSDIGHSMTLLFQLVRALQEWRRSSGTR